MQGLRKQEDAEFEAFMEIVQEYAKRKDCVFFVDSGEGNEIQMNGIDGEDLSGWLIPIADADEFEQIFKQNTGFDDIPEKYTDSFRYAKWQKKNGNIIINFTDR